LFFDLNGVVGLCLDDGTGDFFLTAHGVDGDNSALQSEGFDQFRDRRDLIGLVIGFDLSEHQADI